MNVATPSFTRLSDHQATEKVSPSKKVTISNCDLTRATQCKQIYIVQYIYIVQ